MHADEEELPNSCRASDVAVFALHVLNRLYQPLIPQDVAEKLWVAASTAVIKPQSVRSTEHMGSKGGGTLEAAQFIARIAVCELQPAGAGGKSRRGDLYTLFKGIIKTLQEIANSDQVCCHTPGCACFRLQGLIHTEKAYNRGLVFLSFITWWREYIV